MTGASFKAFALLLPVLATLELPLVLVAAPAAASGPGLSVDGGLLVKDGKPYRGIGANYFDLFARRLKDPADKSYRAGLRQLAEAGIPFVRFMGGGFWPVDWDLYRQDPDGYFKLLDEVVAAAEEYHIGLIPSLFWSMPAVPDLVGEPMDQLGNPNSKTIAWIRRYTSQVVRRYQASPAVWGWEFGNEYNLGVDLPNAAAHRPAVHPALKTALVRTARDELKSAQMLLAVAEFARAVRRHDRHRMIVTGHSIPRPSAFHNTSEGSWQADTVEQFSEILRRDNPDPYDTISVHVYPDRISKRPAWASAVGDRIRTAADCARQAHKALFVGEFGVPRNEYSAREGRAVFEQFVAAIEQSDVALAAFWVFDFARQKDWNVTLDSDRSYMIELVAAANRRMRKSSAQRSIP